MSKDVNTVHLLGRIGKDPEMKYTTGGTTIASVSLATSSRFKDKAGDYQDKTQWHNLKAFGKVAEIFEKYVTKGKQIYLRGEIQYDSWDDKETGQKKYRTEIVVHELTLLGGGAESKDREGIDQQPRDQKTGEIDDSEIPF